MKSRIPLGGVRIVALSISSHEETDAFVSGLWCLTVSLSASHWYPGSGVVLDYIDS